MIHETFNIEPVEQQRPRAARRGASITIYDPPKVKAYKRRIKFMALERNITPYDEPIEIDVKIYRRNQKNVSRVEMDRREHCESLPSVKPDLDNYIKSLSDALNGVFWTDDSKICKLTAGKFYSQKPRIEVIVKGISE